MDMQISEKKSLNIFINTCTENNLDSKVQLFSPILLDSILKNYFQYLPYADQLRAL